MGFMLFELIFERLIVKKLSEIKAKLKKHAPGLIVAALTVAGSAGWIVAGVYAQRIKQLETVDPDAWPTIEVSPATMKSVQQGDTLKYRQAQYGNKTFYSQSTTMDDFGASANRAFDQFKKTGNFEEEYDNA
jgi:hypothetical protein